MTWNKINDKTKTGVSKPKNLPPKNTAVWGFGHPIGITIVKYNGEVSDSLPNHIIREGEEWTLSGITHWMEIKKPNEPKN